MKVWHVDGFRCTPTHGQECLEAIWSEGRACRECKVACYRRGWCKARVDADNLRLVKAKVEYGTPDG
jgi:hypothetical protein